MLLRPVHVTDVLMDGGGESEKAAAAVTRMASNS